MNATQRGRISDSYYHSNMSKRDLTDTIARLKGEVSDLSEKVKDMEGEAYGLRCTIGDMSNEIARLEEENAALSELVRSARRKEEDE